MSDPTPTSSTFQLHAVVAMAANRVIGRDGRLPWHLPEDLAFFKRLTTGHPVLMGRKTFESIGRPLPKRRNLVLSRRGHATTPSPPEGMEVLASVEELPRLGLSGPVFVIGGAEIYRLLLPHCESVYLTLLRDPYEGDAWMPPFEHDFPVTEKLATHDAFDIWLHRRG